MDFYDIFDDDEEPCNLTKSEITLLNKIKSGDVKGVQRFLSYKRTRKTFDINCVTNDGFIPLSVPIIAKDGTDKKRMIQLLLKYGAEINYQNNDGQTALHKACIDYNCTDTRAADFVNVLLENGADPHIRDKDGQTPLHLACYIGVNVAIAKSLLLYNADVNCLDNDGETPLMHASRESSYDGSTINEVEMITTLLERNASVNLQNNIGETALHIAFEQRNYDSVETLLRRGNANVNILDKYGQSPLMYAALTRDSGMNVRRMITILMEKNALINLQNVRGETALYNACGWVYDTAIAMLISFGADPNIKANNGWAPLHRLCQWSSGENSARMLLENNTTDMNCQDNNGDTPLHCLFKNSRLDNAPKFVQMILNHNPDLRIIDNDKKTTLDLAKERGHNEYIKCIEEHMHKVRCQMYTFNRKTWCHHLLDSPNNNNMKSISPDKKRKR